MFNVSRSGKLNGHTHELAIRRGRWSCRAAASGACVLPPCLLLLLPSLKTEAARAGPTSQRPAKITVIELVVTARDSIPIRPSHQRTAQTGYPGWVQDSKLVLHPEAARQQRGRSVLRRGYPRCRVVSEEFCWP